MVEMEYLVQLLALLLFTEAVVVADHMLIILKELVLEVRVVAEMEVTKAILIMVPENQEQLILAVAVERITEELLLQFMELVLAGVLEVQVLLF
jgi:hypothetical protein